MSTEKLLLIGTGAFFTASIAAGVIQLAEPTATAAATATKSTASATPSANCGNCQGNQGNGNGNGGPATIAPANPPSKYLTVPDAKIVIPQLKPGLTVQAKVTVINGNSGSTSVQSITGVVQNLPAVCGVSVTPVTISGGYQLDKKGDSHEFLVPVVMADSGSNQNACKTLAYSIKFTAFASGK